MDLFLQPDDHAVPVVIGKTILACFTPSLDNNAVTIGDRVAECMRFVVMARRTLTRTCGICARRSSVLSLEFEQHFLAAERPHVYSRVAEKLLCSSGAGALFRAITYLTHSVQQVDCQMLRRP